MARRRTAWPKFDYGFSILWVYEPTSVVFSLVYGRPYPAHRLQALLSPLPLLVCFVRGGLDAGEKPTRGELVRSTHRVPSPFISSYDFPSRPFGEPRHSMGLAAAYGPFKPLCIIRCVERNRVSTPERATRAWPIKGVEDPSENYTARRRTRPGPATAHSAQPAAECRWKRPAKGPQQPPPKSAVLLYLRVLFL